MSMQNYTCREKKVKGCEDPKEQVRLNSLCDDSDVNAKKHKRERDIKAKT